MHGLGINIIIPKDGYKPDTNISILILIYKSMQIDFADMHNCAIGAGASINCAEQFAESAVLICILQIDLLNLLVLICICSWLLCPIFAKQFLTQMPCALHSCDYSYKYNLYTDSCHVCMQIRFIHVCCRSSPFNIFRHVTFHWHLPISLIWFC